MMHRILAVLQQRMVRVCTLASLVMVPGFGLWGGGVPLLPGNAVETARSPDLHDARSLRFADIYGFPLRATSRARGAGGAGHLRLAQSPFGIAMTADGHVVYDLEVTVKGLRPGSAMGGTYIAWLTTPELDRTEMLGVIGSSGTFTYRVSAMNKFIFLVSLEESGDVSKRSGPTVLRGISPSGLMQNMESHELFSTMPHDR